MPPNDILNIEPVPLQQKELTADDVRSIVNKYLDSDTLRRQLSGDLQSSNYKTNSTGWKITGAGDAEFQSLTLPNSVAFGGNGSDGALTVSSGTTTINLGGNAIVIKNYSSISITGTGVLGFSNPHANGSIVFLRCSGDVTITSSTVPCIDGRLMGSAGGAGGASNGGLGGVGKQYGDITDTLAHYGGTSQTAGVALTLLSQYADTINHIQLNRGFFILPGPGGGGGVGGINATTGGTAGGAGGAGGTGGISLGIECAKHLNFTGTINGTGQIGSNGSQGAVPSGGNAGGGGGGGGGGGAGGSVVILYNLLTANTGTITVTGGNGGVGGAVRDGSGGTGGSGKEGGGGAGFWSGAGGAGGSGGGHDVGAAGSNSTTATGGAGGGAGGDPITGQLEDGGGGGGGGAGADGWSLVTTNIWFP